MATTVQYGSVILHNVDTREWDESVLYDETGVDPIGKTYNLTFDAVVHQQVLPVTGATVYADDGAGVGGYANPVARCESIVRQLGIPRQLLVVTVGDEVRLRVSPYAGQASFSGFDVDTDQGPKPVRVQQIGIAGDRTFRIRFTIRATTLNCIGTKTTAGALAINNRWSVREMMDENFTITREISGILKFPIAPVTNNPFLPDAFRHLCIPGLEDGFRRKNVSFETDKTGSKLVYSIVDQQSHYAPPYPATTMRGSHTCATGDGIKFSVSCRVTLTGAPNTDARALIQRAIQVCQYRTNFQGQTKEEISGVNRIITECTITEEIGDIPSVEVSLSYEESPTDTDSNGAPRTFAARLKTNRFGTLILPLLKTTDNYGNNEEVSAPYQVNKFQVPSSHGYASWGAARSATVNAFLKCVLQSPCAGAQSLGAGQVPVAPFAPTTGGRNREESTDVYDYGESPVDDPDPTLPGTWSDDHLNAMYITVSRIDKYHTNYNRVALPIANGGSSGSPTHTIVGLSVPTSRRTIQIDYERAGVPPVIPNWGTHKIGDVTLYVDDVLLEPVAPRYTSDGRTLIYRIRQTVKFLADRAIPDNAVIPIGRLPTTGPDRGESEIALSQIKSPTTNGSLTGPSN